MPHALATIIDAAFEDRANITPKTAGDVRQAVESALHLLDAGKARVAEKIRRQDRPGRWTGQSMAEEGRAAVLPPQRHDRHPRRPRRRHLV